MKTLSFILFSLLTTSIALVACGGEKSFSDGADADRDKQNEGATDTDRPPPNTYDPHVCEGEGRLSKVGTFIPIDDFSMLRGFDVAEGAMHFLVQRGIDGTVDTCEWRVRSIALATGEPTEELRFEEPCLAGNIEGGLAVLDGKRYVVAGDAHGGHVMRFDATGLVDVGELPGTSSHHPPHIDGANGAIVSGRSSLVPGASAATDLGPLHEDMQFGYGPEIDGDRLWVQNDAFEVGMNNRLGFVHRNQQNKACTFFTEDIDPLTGLQLQFFAVDNSHVYIPVAATSESTKGRTVIVELQFAPDGTPTTRTLPDDLAGGTR